MLLGCTLCTRSKRQNKKAQNRVPPKTLLRLFQEKLEEDQARFLVVLRRGGLPRSKKIKVLRRSGTANFSRSSLGFLPTVSHRSLIVSSPTNEAMSANAMCSGIGSSCAPFSRTRGWLRRGVAAQQRKAITGTKAVSRAPRHESRFPLHPYWRVTMNARPRRRLFLWRQHD